MSLTAVLVTGLFAGGVSCAAVQGGLLTGVVTRQHAASGTGHKEPGTRSGNPAAAAARRAAADSQPTRASRLAEDLTPVGGFLIGKLGSHTLLGALLGALGAAVQLSPHTRALAQLAAGALVVCFGLAQLGVPGFRSFTVTPPASWSRFVRGRARSTTALAPAVLGFATILIPCGITLSVMALALASGSAITGAATMAVFVVGTSPLFTLIGYAANKAATAWAGRLATATGVLLLAMGAYTLNGGLTLIGSPLAAKNLAAALGGPTPAADASTVTVEDGSQTAVITVRAGGYFPANAAVDAGVPTTLVFRSDNARGCERALVIPALDQDTVLPENGDTTLEVGSLEKGTIEYSCAMGMYSGLITVQ
jgi:sulfite exporter TauE/SafE